MYGPGVKSAMIAPVYIAAGLRYEPLPARTGEMTLNEQLRPRPVRMSPWVRYAPGVALGLFAARLLGEWVGLPGVWAAAVLGVLLAAAGGWLMARWPPARTWPALLLLAYVIWPEVSPSIWRPVLAVAAVAGALGEMGRRGPTRVPQGLDGLVLFAAALALYVATLAPDVLAADSGELQVVAAQLGVAHPPGFPLYVMLAHLFTRVPSISPAYGVNLLSAVFAAATVTVVYRAGILLCGRRLPALVGAVALGTATTFWSQATTANVRSLTGLLAALLIYAALAFRVAQGRPRDRWLILAALLMTLGMTHHVSLAILVAVVLAFLLAVDPALRHSPRRWLRPGAAALLGLLPLLYLPLRAGADVRGASPGLATLPGFLEHVLATGFRGDLFYYVAPADLAARLMVMGNVMTFQFAPLLLGGMVAGLALLLRRDRPLAWLLGGTFVAYLLVTATYRAPQTVEYMLPAYVPAALVVAWLIGHLPVVPPSPRWGGGVAGLVAASLLVAALGQLSGHVSASGARHEASDARDVAARLLAAAPPDGVVLAHWHWATPLWYLRDIEGVRPDVDVRFVFPEGEAYDVTWARRTAAAWAEGRAVMTTWIPASPLPGLPTPEPVGEALLYLREARRDLPGGYTPLALQLGDAIDLLGVRVEVSGSGTLAPGNEAVVTLAWRPRGQTPVELGLFAHLVGPDGTLYAQDDRVAQAAEGISLTRFALTPRPATPSGELTLFAGVSGGDRQAVMALPIGAIAEPPFTGNPAHRRLVADPAITLIGYDWDESVEGHSRLYLHWRTGADSYVTEVIDDTTPALPAFRGAWGVPVERWRFPRNRNGHYVPLGQGIVWTGGTLAGRSLAPGEATVLAPRFASGRPVNRDLVVSVRLIGLEPDGFHWAWWDLRDAVPAMGGIPTLKWVDGSVVRSPHRVMASEEASSGQSLTGALTLYDAFTSRPLPILDERLTAVQPWIPLGWGVIEQ